MTLRASSSSSQEDVTAQRRASTCSLWCRNYLLSVAVADRKRQQKGIWVKYGRKKDNVTLRNG